MPERVSFPQKQCWKKIGWWKLLADAWDDLLWHEPCNCHKSETILLLLLFFFHFQPVVSAPVEERERVVEV